MLLKLFSILALGGFIGVSSAKSVVNSCDKTVYLTFDTGNMSVATHVADVLKKHQIKATFFLANEKTFRGDFALDDSWKDFWLNLVKEGHSFGSHTFDHTYWQKDGRDGTVLVKSQFGAKAGKVRELSATQMCQEIQSSNRRFEQLTGRPLDPIWRAPGGKTSPRLIEMGQQCNYQHIAWAKAGFLGDELPSHIYSNKDLLSKALHELKDGDITMAHLGIWSRKDPWAPEVLEPLILGLKERGFCFAPVPTKNTKQSKHSS
jgi:peptidoglycan/xylan/chitin deacetylase (PgdA/CDA1 family)